VFFVPWEKLHALKKQKTPANGLKKTVASAFCESIEEIIFNGSKCGQFL